MNIPAPLQSSLFAPGSFSALTNIPYYESRCRGTHSILRNTNSVLTRRFPLAELYPRPDITATAAAAMMELTDDEKNNIINSAAFRHFFSVSSRIIERSLGDGDFTMMYTNYEVEKLVAVAIRLDNNLA